MSHSRTGAPTLHKVARQMCKYIVQFEPLLRKAYPDNVALQTALSAALVACSALDEELVAVLEPGV